MNAKEYIANGYELFSKGDMVAYFDTIDDDIVFTMPGDSHPFSGVYKGKKAVMETVSYTHLTLPTIYSV